MMADIAERARESAAGFGAEEQVAGGVIRVGQFIVVLGESTQRRHLVVVRGGGGLVAECDGAQQRQEHQEERERTLAMHDGAKDGMNMMAPRWNYDSTTLHATMSS
ncbi:hypothetical protein AaE_013574 [Aphanomyces astaci]|uniref:Uncharacterized protein n=1 Tax=Aphanomyces astaci TaxID=112090 RepID=A0A6A4Z9F0_APHAT|nr:hypothetical protein AaE_013574 [Aphanomyces astaci]